MKNVFYYPPRLVSYPFTYIQSTKWGNLIIIISHPTPTLQGTQDTQDTQCIGYTGYTADTQDTQDT